MSRYPKTNDVERLYRSVAAPDLHKFRVVIGESDLQVLTNSDLEKLMTEKLKYYRRILKEFIYRHPTFKETLEPFPLIPEAPSFIQWMINVSSLAGVGPMAAVAGAIAGIMGEELSGDVSDLIIENGGDIYLRSSVKRIISIYAGESPLSNRVGLVIHPTQCLGICTSAGTVGPSLSFGKADAVVILSPDVALADAVATATANRISQSDDFQHAIDFARKINNIIGVLMIKDDKMAVWGSIELTPV